MPEANFPSILLSPTSRPPRITPAPFQKPKLLDRLPEALRSRHYFVAHLVEDGCDIRNVQKLLGHKDVKTTIIYTQVRNGRPADVRSSADSL